MTTIDNFTDGFNLLELGIDLNVEPINYRKERNKAILKIAKVIATPIVFVIVVFKNAKAYKKIKKANHALRRHMDKFDTIFQSASEEQKIEMYASLNYLSETINNTTPTIMADNIKGGFLTKAMIRTYKSLLNYINSIDAKYYKIVYPDNGDPNDPEFIQHVFDAHAKSNV